MKESAKFEVVGTLKSYRRMVATKPYAFLSVAVNKSTYISATAFEPYLDKLTEADEGKQVRLGGVIRSYKNNRTQEWTLGYTVHDVEVLGYEGGDDEVQVDSYLDHQSSNEAPTINEEDLPW